MDINNRNNTRLCSDVINGYYANMDQLISNGANINYRHAGGNTIIMLAIIFGRTNFVNLLTEKYKASVFIQNYQKEDAIDLARKTMNSFILEKIEKRALEETRMMSHNDIFRIVVEIISDITGIMGNKIFPGSHMELDLHLYEGNSYLSPNTKLWKVLPLVERRFRLDSHNMDFEYRKLFDPEINGKPTIWRLIEIISEEVNNRDKISV